ncbi:MAG TPA: hypothetical protein VK469_20950 [Candidatus Kapabacteria bacterium]|nr:hypothetical protein [Candidatus Kapabacteria bacterium]
MNKKWLKILAVTFIALFVSLSSGCQKNKYDITGIWRVDFVLGTAGYFEVGFEGNSTSGTVFWNNQIAGEYEVADKDLEFVLRITFLSDGNVKTFIYHFVGAFESDNRMNGTVNAYDPDVQGSQISGTWFAQKI